MILAPGTKLGPYEILSPIGAGGMGEVYRARDPRVGRNVAIKVSSEQFSDRFSREIHAVAALNHSNICTLYDVGPNYLVMELVEGPTLADRIKQGPIPLEESLEIARQIADALEAAHEKGIVHRDLKPGNIKLRPDGTVKVLDFGLAKVEERAAMSLETSPTLSVAQTAAGVLLGTAAYMSPEQARGKPVDKRADIWAFGVVLYEMLTGRQLFLGETVSDTLAAVLKEEPDCEKIPARVRTLLCRCLEKDPKKRLRDIGDAFALIENAPESASVKRPWLAWGIVAVLLMALVLLAGRRFFEKPSISETPVRSQIALPENVTVDPSDSFSLSPDGRHLAFTAAGSDGVLRLWIRTLDALQARQVPGTEFNWIPMFFWSPDSHFIAFSSGGKLKKIDIGGGAPQSICDLSMSALGGSWNRDDLIIFGTGPAGIMSVPGSGGVASALSKPHLDRQEIGYYLPVFLPDGRHFVYFCSSTTPGHSGVYVGSIDARPEGQVAKQVLATSLAAAYVPASDSYSAQLLFLRDQILMSQAFDENRLEVTGAPTRIAEKVGSFAYFASFAASSNGVLIYRSNEFQRTRATWFDRQGKSVGSAGGTGSIYGLAISPSGAQAAIGLENTLTGSAFSIDLWLVDLLGSRDTRLTFGKSLNSTPVWTPDGNGIIFASDRSGFNNLYQKPASGAKPEQVLFESRETKIPTSCSPDGRFLLYTVVDPKTKGDIWILPLEADKKPIPFLHTENDEIDGRFSPDMQWIAYVCDESGSSEIYVRAFPHPSEGANPEASAKWMVSQGGGRGPRWRGDGKELYYIAQDGNVMAVEIKADGIFRAGRSKPLFPAPRNRSVYAYSPLMSTWDVASDGTRFLIPAPLPESSSTSFNVVLNWTSLLKQ